MSDKPDLGQVALAWWEALPEDPGGRASLRRCSTVADATFVPAFHRLRWAAGEVRAETLALIAVVLSHVRSNAAGASVGEQMGSGKGDRAVVSELRFRRLLERPASEPDDLAHDLIRVLRLLDGKLNIPDLVKGLQQWGWRTIPTQKKWASDYFDAGR